MRFVRSHLGKRGKAQLCKTLAISDLFDDRDDILWEAQSLGVTDWAIRKRGQSHPGHKRAFDKLADAVEALLRAEGLHGPLLKGPACLDKRYVASAKSKGGMP